MSFELGGFLPSILALRAISPDAMGEFASDGDFCHAESGELLVLPVASGLVPTAFCGVESLGESTLGVVTELTGAEAMNACLLAGEILAGGDQKFQSALFAQLLRLSGCLEKLGGEGQIVRIGDEGGCLATIGGGRQLPLPIA